MGRRALRTEIARVPFQLGQVAQLVEQGTENPRVGGSTPSLATIFLLVGLVAGCGNDSCEQLCDTTRTRVRGCLDEWPVGWEAFDATSAADFRSQCRESWAATRADLEPRELEDALDQCQESVDILADLRDDGSACDALRAMLLAE